MLDRAIANANRHRVARLGLFEHDRGERAETQRPEIAHPSLPQRLDAANRFGQRAAEPVLRDDAVERGEKVPQSLLADVAAAAPVAGQPAPSVALNGKAVGEQAMTGDAG